MSIKKLFNIKEFTVMSIKDENWGTGDNRTMLAREIVENRRIGDYAIFRKNGEIVILFWLASVLKELEEIANTPLDSELLDSGGAEIRATIELVKEFFHVEGNLVTGIKLESSAWGTGDTFLETVRLMLENIYVGVYSVVTFPDSILRELREISSMLTDEELTAYENSEAFIRHNR